MTDTERLLAIEEIKQVKARYFRCMDTKDWAGFTAVFAPDGKVDYSPAAVDASDWKASGAANVVALVRKVVEPAVTIHHGHMAEVEVTAHHRIGDLRDGGSDLLARRIALQDDARLGPLL